MDSRSIHKDDWSFAATAIDKSGGWNQTERSYCSPTTTMGTRSTVRTIWCSNPTAISILPTHRSGFLKASTIRVKLRCRGSIVCPKMAQ